MARTILTVVFALAVAGVVPASAVADTPLENHVISRSAYAAFSGAKGCLLTSVLISSSDSLFMPAHGTGGGVSHLGLTSVAIVVENTCAEIHSLAAGGGGGVLTVANWFGQTADQLRVHGHLASARLNATIPMVDEVSGDTALAAVDLVWRATSPYVAEPVHYHQRYPGFVVLNTNSNSGFRDGVASGTVMMNGVNWTPEMTTGLLETTRFHCRQIGFGQGGSDWGLCYGGSQRSQAGRGERCRTKIDLTTYVLSSSQRPGADSGRGE